MSRIKIIANPIAGRGGCGRAIPALHAALRKHDLTYELVLTEHRGHAIDLADQALSEGFDIVVAAGGDGTCNEVVNGLMRHSGGEKVGTMSAIPLGSGCDFSHAVGMPPDLDRCAERLACGETRWIDVGMVTDSAGHTRYFDNTVGVGFDGVVTLEAMSVKHVTGLALYLPVVLKTVFISMKPPRCEIHYNGHRPMHEQILMLTVCNGPREGGGFMVAPDARIDDGLFDVLIARNIPKLQVLGLVPHVMKGTHIDKEPVTMLRTDHVTVTSPDNLIAHVDGEMLCTEQGSLTCQMLPGRLQVVAG